MIDGLKQKFSMWWDKRSEREQRILAVSIVLGVVAIFHGSVYKPFADEHTTALEAFRQATSDYRWLKEQVREIESMGGGVAPVQEGPDEMQASLEKHLSDHGIQTIVERVERRGKVYFEVRLKDIKGSTAMRWIETLSSAGYRVSRFKMETLGGKVSGRVIVAV